MNRFDTYACCYRRIGDNHADYCAGTADDAPRIITLERLRDFIIDASVTVTEQDGRATDVVLTSTLVALYQSESGRDFYRCGRCDGEGVVPRMLPSGPDIPTCPDCRGKG